jgi:hypothetical protein
MSLPEAQLGHFPAADWSADLRQKIERVGAV